MMTGAKIILRTGIDAPRDRLAGLAGVSWMMSLPQRRAAYSLHPAGRGRPGRAAHGGAGLVAVTFGIMSVPAADHIVLPVEWEPVEPGDEFAIQLEGSVILAPAATRGYSALTLSGAGRLPEASLTPDGRGRARPALIEAAREFITGVARDITRDAGSGCLGQSWAW
jgi:hypothetical protein